MKTENAEIKVYSLFNQSGKIEELKLKSLPKYTMLKAYGFAMGETDLAIIEEPAEGKTTQRCVKLSEHEAGFTQIDEYIRPISETFGIGNYYYDDLRKADPQEVEKYIKLGELADIRRAKEAAEKAAADTAERNNLPKLYPHLIVNLKDDFKTTKKNIVADLKQNFPKIKFSVKKDHYSSYYIRWTDGPTEDEVNKITGRYQDHASDITGDYWDSCPDNFNDVFGGFRFVSTSRYKSEGYPDLYKEIIKISNYAETPTDDHFINIAYRVWNKTSFPKDAVITGIERTDIDCGSEEDFYRITFTAPQEEVKPVLDITTDIKDIKVIDYSEKAFALVGEGTKAIKDELKQLGGRFNFKLKCGAGWIFSKKKQTEVMQLINQ